MISLFSTNIYDLLISKFSAVNRLKTVEKCIPPKTKRKKYLAKRNAQIKKNVHGVLIMITLDFICKAFFLKKKNDHVYMVAFIRLDLIYVVYEEINVTIYKRVTL